VSLQEKQNYNSQWKASKHTAAARKDGYIIRAMRKARRREEGDGKEEAMTVARTDCSVATVATNLLLWGCDLRARMLLLMVECHNSVAIFNWSKRLATTKVELWRVVWAAVIWCVWKLRNECIFREQTLMLKL